MRVKFYIAFALLLTICLGRADTDALIRSLRPSGHVNDYANVMDPSQRDTLERVLRDHAARTGIEIAVVSLASLEGGEINDVATRLYESWGIGDRKTDKGALLLAAIDERKLRIEVGYGLEGDLTDAATGRLLDADVVPDFRAGRPGRGLMDGGLALVEATGGRIIDWQSKQKTAVREKPSAGQRLFSTIMIVFFILFAIRHPWLALMLLSSGRGGRYGGGGFGGGGFGGFGGGLSGGGGATRGW